MPITWMNPADVAEIALEAVDAGELWAISHPEYRSIVEDRDAGSLAAFLAAERTA